MGLSQVLLCTADETRIQRWIIIWLGLTTEETLLGRPETVLHDAVAGGGRQRVAATLVVKRETLGRDPASLLGDAVQVVFHEKISVELVCFK